jgi:hypothetical protein
MTFVVVVTVIQQPPSPQPILRIVGNAWVVVVTIVIVVDVAAIVAIVAAVAGAHCCLADVANNDVIVSQCHINDMF